MMKTAVFVSKFVAGTLLLLGQTISRADILIDSFQTSQSAQGGALIYNVAAGGGILGGERDFNTFLAFSANGASPGQLRVAFPEGLLTGRVGGQIVYDG